MKLRWIIVACLTAVSPAVSSRLVDSEPVATSGERGTEASGSHSRTGPESRKHPEDPIRIAFVMAEAEYKTKDTLPKFARRLLRPKARYRFDFLHVDPKDPWNIPGLEVLEKADLLVLSVRRRALPAVQMEKIVSYLKAGKPLVALRTSSHAFDTRGKVLKRPGYVDWPEFDREVLGCDYQGHHGNKGKESITFVWRPMTTMHPIVKGLPSSEFRVSSSLYKSLPLASGAKALLMARAGDRRPHEPVAWTHSYRGGRVFYTSLGHPDDFRDERFQKLLREGIRWALSGPPKSKREKNS